MTATLTDPAQLTQPKADEESHFTKRKVVVLLSGGLDSAVLLWERLRLNDDVVAAITFDYGQRHREEIAAAAKLAAAAGVPNVLVDFHQLASLLPGSSLTDPAVPVPHGHYKDEAMRVTVVPNRNMIIGSIAAGIAISREATVVFYAAHAGDQAVYPDCRPQFVSAMNQALKFGNYAEVSLQSPYLNNSKAAIVGWGGKMGVPMDITWSCYDPQEGNGGQKVHCGLCGTCVERREAFSHAGVTDPTAYKATQ